MVQVNCIIVHRIHKVLGQPGALAFCKDDAVIARWAAGYTESSFEDILIRIKEDIPIPTTRHCPPAILTLDLDELSDDVAHKAIHNLATGCRERMYNYVSNFLSNRQGNIKIGDASSDSITLGDGGTPQGSVLCPMLFIIALLELPKRLKEIPYIKHGLYADDITIWTGTDSIGGLQDTLQLATDTVYHYAKEWGLACSTKIVTSDSTQAKHKERRRRHPSHAGRPSH